MVGTGESESAKPDFRETLYTVDRQGHRRWVYPSHVFGRYFRARTVVISFLLVIYASLPWLTINGRQAILLNIVERKFIVFGTVFWATDSLFLAMLLAGLALSLFFFTAVFGRVWCGWACPETVFLEFLFRPLERLIEGTPTNRRKLDAAPWSARKIRIKATKLVIFAIVAWFLASTFLAYFIGADRLLRMMGGSPADHPFEFVMTLALTGILLFQFGWFREQFCTVLCPYARFQSVLMDTSSLLVGYDRTRGEPRGKVARATPIPGRGDCVDCGLCVRVCPTGIDIRNGTQLECIHCAACIDACDSIMEKVGRPPGLIRYDTENGLAGTKSRFIRPRIVLYALLLVLYGCAFVVLLMNRQLSEFQIVRQAGAPPYTVLTDGRIANQLLLHLSNKGGTVERYRVEIAPNERFSPSQIEIIVPLTDYPVAPGELASVPMFVTFPRALLGKGSLPVDVIVQGESGYREKQRITLLGPDRE